MITLVIFSLLGSVLFVVLNMALQFYTKNVAINTNTLRGREAYHRLGDAIRSAVSSPVLINASFAPISGSGPAPGFAFHRVSGGPFRVHNNSNANTSSIRLRTGSFTPEVGDIVHLPLYGIRRTITGVGGFPSDPTVRNIQVDANFGQQITVTNPGFDDFIVVAYIDQRSAFLVENTGSRNELRFYPRAGGGPFIRIVDNVASRNPFRRPAGVTNTRQILIELSCDEPGMAALLGLWRRDGLNISSRVTSRTEL
ncbi:MAG: hypothetical protein SNJ52_02705 [Verrucomicrobiia bacterium]